MNRFATLLDALVYEGQRNAKLALMADYFRTTPDPERGLALAALTGALRFRHAKPALVRTLTMERVDPVLFGLSYDYVGDLAETVALIWPVRPGANATPGLADVVAALDEATKADLPGLLARLLDALDANGRWALIKLITGSLRVGVSARLAKTAVAQLGGLDPDAIEEVWPALAPPYAALFAWAEGRGPQPPRSAAGLFRPVMLAQALDEAELPALDPAAYAAEWKWDGIRVEAIGEGGVRRLLSRAGEDISAAFPDVLGRLSFDAVIDGELLILKADGAPAPFADLQQRLNRKTVSPALAARHPAAIRAYDLLQEGADDVRALPFGERRARLEAWHARERPTGVDLSPLIPFGAWDELAAARASSAPLGAEGVMLKRWDSPYVPGRPKGLWFKWKRDPYTVDAVLMYAQRGHGKRSSFYSDYTFGVWKDGALVPVGKAYFGFTDAELAQIDKWVRAHTTARYGPVREVTHTPDDGLVVEVAFEGLQRSPRHRSGLAMRFPRISRLRWDKRPRDADAIAALEMLLPG